MRSRFSRECLTQKLHRVMIACIVVGLTMLAVSPPTFADDTVAAGKAQAGVKLWSFKPLARPTVPAVRDTQWARNDVDRFILARIEADGLKPNRDADRATLIRRAAFDLLGLPPTEKELTAFLNDPAPDDEAFARVVDQYLDSRCFGERWGRHWLDVVRYSDCVGRTWNAPFTYAWRYRDYVIDAFDNDKPYDRFITEQLAGDLLPVRTVSEERETIVATGLLALGSMDLTEGRQEGFIMDQIDDQIDVTTRSFLGLTVSCARCHDHKYEPITMRDYYALAGIFYSTKTLSGQRHKGTLGYNGYVDPDNLRVMPAADGSRPTGIMDRNGLHSMSDFMAVRSTTKQAIPYTTDPNLAMGLAEGRVRDCELRVQGDAYEFGAAPPRGDVQIPGLPSMEKIPADVSGRRELARWIASAENPLTARVMVNRVWQHLLGRGIVATVDDFGSTGELPTHPELLDHLAMQFVEDGWSVKKLIRSIMLSRTYRLSSAGDATNEQRDPQNLRYWRANMRRLEVEAIRDSMLWAAGRLKFTPPDGIQVAGYGGKGLAATTQSLLAIDAPYRTVYLPVLRSLLPELYDTFDFPEPSQIKGQREVTTVAPQALFMLNSSFATDRARDAADRLLREPNLKDEDRVRLAYRRLFSRSPDAEEVSDAIDLLESLRPSSSHRDPELYRWTTLVQALMASAEFRYVK
jgi:hypothetical protein